MGDTEHKETNSFFFYELRGWCQVLCVHQGGVCVPALALPHDTPFPCTALSPCSHLWPKPLLLSLFADAADPKVQADGKNWHAACFTCKECKSQITLAKWAQVGGSPPSWRCCHGLPALPLNRSPHLPTLPPPACRS